MADALPTDRADTTVEGWTNTVTCRTGNNKWLDLPFEDGSMSGVLCYGRRPVGSGVVDTATLSMTKHPSRQIDPSFRQGDAHHLKKYHPGLPHRLQCDRLLDSPTRQRCRWARLPDSWRVRRLG